MPAGPTTVTRVARLAACALTATALIGASPATGQEAQPPSTGDPEPAQPTAAPEPAPPPADAAPGPSPEPPEPDPAPYLETGGRVVVEVETGSPTSPSDRAWLPSRIAGAVGSALQAGPDGGPSVPWNAVATSAPGVAVPVMFSTPGVYHVWVRAWAPNPAGDSLHLGLDGSVQTLSSHLTTKVYRQWNWFRTRITYPTARVVVPDAGLHTVNVWMREDGLHIDRLVMSVNPLAAPSGAGPPASPRGTS